MAGADKSGSAKREVYIEYVAHGGSVKVTAIDAATGTEVSIIGPANGLRSALEQAAVNKLEYVLKKRNFER